MKLAPRFIPAGAGNTRTYCSFSPICPVHPRGRGEHVAPVAALRAAFGSSPRARGTPFRRRPLPIPPRFIPAGAGNTPPNNGTAIAPPVHPRGRGEHFCACDWVSPSSGSSPRARGTLIDVPALVPDQRFIPAGAGNTSSGRRSRQARPVHPRGRGEHTSARCWRISATGSSPRARGTRLRRGARSCRLRFIPAGAGNTC